MTSKAQVPILVLLQSSLGDRVAWSVGLASRGQLNSLGVEREAGNKSDVHHVYTTSG